MGRVNSGKGDDMTEKLNAKRLEELGESEYRELESVYGKLKDLRASIAQMHDDLLKEATPPTFDKLEAIYLMVEDVFAGLERYLLPECDPNSAFEPVRREE
ncbi:MAG: hypothetical protein FD174_3362 [Geobacteraceae bacterium]|nr:MAG: hypothetical protein FD174_3362 [Geobacteraceae bacterium]